MQPSGDRPVVISFRLQNIVGWAITALLCLVPLFIWIGIMPLSNRFSSVAMTLGSIGKITGFIGLVMYALNLVYATRLKFLENWFGGLNRVYIAHHILGGLALIFLVFHPLLLVSKIAFTSVREAALFFLPHGLTPVGAFFDANNDFHYEVLQQWAILFGSIALFGMVILLVLTFFVKLPYRLWLFTHKFLGLAFFFAGLHVIFISSDTSQSPTLKWYLIIMCAIGIIAFVYKTLLGRILIRKYQYYVDTVEVVGGSVTQLVMSPVKQRMMYKPGQFVFIRFLFSGVDDITTEWHPFSVSSSPKDDFLRLSVKALGDYTGALVNLKHGAIAEIEGAYGKFSYTNYSNYQQIWVAGGIGVTPFLSMARSLPTDNPYKIDLYYSVKTRSELIDVDVLAEISQLQGDNFRIIPFVAVESGFITADFVSKTSNGLKGKEIFICGPPGMMKAMRQQMKVLGVSNANIHSEEFSMS